MQNKERPPRIFTDKKGSYIINGDRKMRITPMNNNKNNNTNQNVVNVILKECRTKQKRKRANKPMQKQPIPMKPLEQQANDANYRLYHIIQDRKREAQDQLNALIQKVQEKSIGIPSTDNSLVAIARNMKKSPSELIAKIEPTVAQQILPPAPVADGFPDEFKEPPQGEVPLPLPPQQMQLIAEPTDIEVNQANVPIVAGEMEQPEMPDIKQQVEDLKQEIEAPLATNVRKVNTFLNRTSIVKKEQMLKLAKKFQYRPNQEGGENDEASRESAKNYLLSNESFITQFIQEFVGQKANNRGNVLEAYKQTLNALLSRGGSGKTLMTGLYDDQINDMLRSEPQYCGCISRDEIHNLQLDDSGKYGFVYNTVPSNKPTKYEGHWRAIYIDLDDDKSIDHYDSFGEPAEEDIQEQIKKLLEQFNLPYYLKWKDNKIVNQRSNSSNCGFFCVNFLQDRFEGIPFVDSTGYSNVMKSEKMIKDKFKYLV